MRLLSKISVIFLLVFFRTTVSFAQLSPGDLATPHAELEGIKNCTSCHEIGQQIKAEKCLDCHTLLKARIRANVGLHSRNEYKNCIDCHSDHQGREFKLVWWKEGRDNFDHRKSRYTLEGKHKDLDCRKCHRAQNIYNPSRLKEQGKDPDVTFLGLERECLSCHHDEHQDQFKQPCLSCHQMNGWKPASGFEHAQTPYPLTGKHQQVLCASCHKNIENSDGKEYAQYTDLLFAGCSNCHTDIHNGRLGNRCVKCHGTTGWKQVVDISFNHDKTRFPLLGKHQTVICLKCHRSDQSLKSLKFKRCSSCHSDYHIGQFAHREQKGSCEECHAEQGFRPARFTIEQHNLTDYPLKGAHLAVPCNLCHPKTFKNTIRFEFTSTRCIACHPDSHNGSASPYISSDRAEEGCAFCHSVESWDVVFFDHTKTKFPLQGKHSSILCSKCHTAGPAQTDRLTIKFNIGSKVCQNCHRDIHQRQFAKEDMTDCRRCHTEKDWQPANFDHNRDSQFKLEGAHQKLACKQCHGNVSIDGEETILFKPMDTSCSACHAKRNMEQRG